MNQANPIHLTQSFNTNLTQVMIMPNINIKRGQNGPGGGLPNGDPNNSNIVMANLLKKHQQEFIMANQQGRKMQNNSKSVGSRSNQHQMKTTTMGLSNMTIHQN